MVGGGQRGDHGPKGIILNGSQTSSPYPAPPLMFPVAASKYGLSRAPSWKKKTGGDLVIKVTETSEEFLSQESELSQ